MNELKIIRDKTKLSDGVNRIGTKAKRASAGVGWIIMNTEVDDIVRNSIETGVVSIITPENEIIQRCLVTTAAIQEIKFPKSTKEKGSLVAWISSPISTTVIIIGVVRATNEKNSLPKENSFQLQRSNEEDHIIIEGIGEGGIINVITRSKQGGQINIKALSEKLIATLDVYVQGQILVEADDLIHIKTEREFTVVMETTEPNKTEKSTASFGYIIGKGFFFKDQFEQEITTEKGKVNVHTKSDGIITASGGDNTVEKALLGESTIKALSNMLDIMKDIIAPIKTLTVNTQSGVVLPATPAQLQEVEVSIELAKKQLDKLKSKNLKNS